MKASNIAARSAGVKTLVCMVLVVVASLLFTKQNVVDPRIGNVTTQQNLSASTPSLRQRHAPRKVTPRPNFSSVKRKQGSDLLHVKKMGPPLPVLEKAMPHVMPGGRWFPTGRTARHRLAIVVPYRDRLNNLQAFLQHMHPFLQNQQLDYGIYIVEQNGTGGFNRAKLFNAGYEIVKAMHNHSCFIFHDVDLLPENRRNEYACRDQGPFHYTTCLDKWEYKDWLMRRSLFRMYKDGLNSLKYTVLDIVFKKLYTHITVDISYSGPVRERNSTLDRLINAACRKNEGHEK
ncbi:hypothetical protein MTO96_010085 [Rhipicephalus appendiculatus]